MNELTRDITETHGKWTKESVWIYRNDNGAIMRAQDEHPSQGVKDAERILEVSRGEAQRETT